MLRQMGKINPTVKCEQESPPSPSRRGHREWEGKPAGHEVIPRYISAEASLNTWPPLTILTFPHFHTCTRLAGSLSRRYVSKYDSDAVKPGTGTPAWTAIPITRRH